MDVRDIILPEEKYKHMGVICHYLTDNHIRTVLLHMIEHGGWLTGVEVAALMGFESANRKNFYSGQLMKLHNVGLLDTKSINPGSLHFKINSDRLFFLNQFIQIFNRLK